MSNFKYMQVGQDPIILSQEEHDFAQKERREGKVNITFRGGTIGIYLPLSSWRPTNQLTDVQERLKLASKALPEGKTKVSVDGLVKYHLETYKRMGWGHGERCIDVCPLKRSKK